MGSAKVLNEMLKGTQELELKRMIRHRGIEDITVRHLLEQKEKGKRPTLTQAQRAIKMKATSSMWNMVKRVLHPRTGIGLYAKPIFAGYISGVAIGTPIAYAGWGPSGAMRFLDFATGGVSPGEWEQVVAPAVERKLKGSIFEGSTPWRIG
jgi:hypothetical protein